MKLLIHGTDIEKSREYYFLEKNKLRNPIALNGEGLTFDLLFQSTENKSLFEEKFVVLIENLLTKNKSNSTELKNITNFINKHKNIDLILWEQSEVSKTSLSLLKDFEVKLFIIPQKMFTFLDQIKPHNSKALIKLFHELRETQEPELILFMLIRQFRLFLQVNGNFLNQIDEVKRMAPWQMSKLLIQAKHFKKDDLIKAYNQLFEIESSQKTGTGMTTSLETSIDFFLSDL